MGKKLLLAALCWGMALAAGAEEAGPPKTHPDSAAWPKLVADDLSDAEFPKGVWTVQNGVLTASQDQCLWTKKKHGDCIVDLEFKTAPGTNSGVIVHCSNLKAWIPNSVEIQIADDFSEKWAKAPKNWHCGAIFGHVTPTKSTVKKPGEWNRMTITCANRMIYVLLNGEQVSVMDMRKWISAKSNPDGSTIPAWLSRPKAELPLEGHIGLQGKHAGAPIYFRNLKVKTLE